MKLYKSFVVFLIMVTLVVYFLSSYIEKKESISKSFEKTRLKRLDIDSELPSNLFENTQKRLNKLEKIQIQRLDSESPSKLFKNTQHLRVDTDSSSTLYMNTQHQRLDTDSSSRLFKNTQHQRLDSISKFCRTRIPSELVKLSKLKTFNPRNFIAFKKKQQKNYKRSEAHWMVWCPVYKAASSNWFYRYVKCKKIK